jgi:hypothetical protein
MSDLLNANVRAFLDANRRFPIISGSVVGSGGKGCHYTLSDGRTFTLSRDECEQVGMPRWASPSQPSQEQS